MSNWKKRNGNTSESTVNTPYNDFKELERQANLGKQIDKLSHEAKQKVLRILEVFLEDEDEK